MMQFSLLGQRCEEDVDGISFLKPRSRGPAAPQHGKRPGRQDKQQEVVLHGYGDMSCADLLVRRGEESLSVAGVWVRRVLYMARS